MKTRTDVDINFGPLPMEKGISLEWRGKIITDRLRPVGCQKSGHPIYVPTVLFDGNPISDYTVTTTDSSANVSVQADGSLLIEMGSSNRVYFTIQYGNYTATFCAVN